MLNLLRYTALMSSVFEIEDIYIHVIIVMKIDRVSIYSFDLSIYRS